jgi:acetyl-CoA carboxylase carboxyl transferase subunit beta
MSWLKKLLPGVSTAQKKGVPEGVWSKCPSCTAILYRFELEKNLNVCSKCQYHIRIPARVRIDQFLDAEGRQELATDVVPIDYLKFRDTKKYKDRLHAAEKESGEKEAILVFEGNVYGIPVVVAAFNFFFIGGSMGAAEGERFVVGVKTAIAKQKPLVCFATSGGARMQEGLFSLFQMGKTSMALAHLSDHHLPYIVVLTDPTMGGVSASLATLGDIIMAEPKALIGFSGPRVIEQTIRETLPEGFQRSEFLLEHGAIDMIIDRRDLRKKIAVLLSELMNRPNPVNIKDEADEFN